MTENDRLRVLLTTAISLLEVAGPNPLLVDENEYYNELEKLRKSCGLEDH